MVSLILKGFYKVLREWIPGFRGRKEGRQKGRSRESYMYECCMRLPFLLRLSLFGSILTHSKSELYTVCFVEFLTL